MSKNKNPFLHLTALVQSLPDRCGYPAQTDALVPLVALVAVVAVVFAKEGR